MKRSTNIHPPTDPRLRKSFIEGITLDRWQNPTAVTLTMKQRRGSSAADPIVCSRNLRHWLNLLHRSAFGNHWRDYGIAPLKRVAILERSSERYHYHLLIERPDTISFDTFAAMLTRTWSETDWAYQQTDVQAAFNVPGWLGYITKYTDKLGDEAIDWHNCYFEMTN